MIETNRDAWQKELDQRRTELKNCEETNKELIPKAQRLLAYLKTTNNRIRHLKGLLERGDCLTITCKKEYPNDKRCGRVERIWLSDLLLTKQRDRVRLYRTMLEHRLCRHHAEELIRAEDQKKLKADIAAHDRSVKDKMARLVETSPEVWTDESGIISYHCIRDSRGNVLKIEPHTMTVRQIELKEG